jgi:hypothetical protein
MRAPSVAINPEAADMAEALNIEQELQESLNLSLEGATESAPTETTASLPKP